MRRFPWVSVALLVVLGLLAALTYPAGRDSDGAIAQKFETVYGIVGWVSVGAALIIGALGVWARAPATLPTALGIVGAGAFAGMWLAQSMEQADPSGLNLGMVVAFSATLVAFAASARRIAVPET
ncbi:MAG TPA: hypothetical protein VM327_02055 [Candidatus Thermoplasmatota archaeon]|nr:hypothetical protein [Candidatus Thermoplasmatota archaeon]